MKLPFQDRWTIVLLELLRSLDALGGQPVLVGGMIPPLLLESLDFDNFEMASQPRNTSDCDVAIAIHGAEKWKEAEELLSKSGFARDPKKNQFRWKHECGLQLDPMPVPSGIESGDPEAVNFAILFIEGDTSAFFRGYELALARYLEIEIELEDGSRHPLRIAGIAALLAMKLQAWTDRRLKVKKDAQDIGWLFQHMSGDIIAAHLREARVEWPATVQLVVSRLEKDFSDPEGQGVLDYVSQHANGLLELTERMRRSVSAAVNEALRLYRAE